MTDPKDALLSSLLQFERDLKAAANRIRELRTDIEIEANRHVSNSPTWEAFKAAEHRPGFCACCDRALSGRKRLLCGAKECRRLFQAIYDRGYRQQEAAP